MKNKRVLAFLLAAIMLFGVPAAAAEPLTSSGESPVIDGSGNSAVSVTAEATQLTVTVPTILPVIIDSYGNITVATDASVINHSYGPVSISAINAEPIIPWQLVGPDYQFTGAKVDSKLVQVSVDDQIAGTNGAIPIAYSWVIQGGNQSHHFDYGVKIPAQRSGYTGQPAKVVFTVDWYEGGGNTDSNTEYSLSLDKDYLTMYTGASEQVHAQTTSETMVALLSAEAADEVTWSTSNNSVASVNDGHISAKAVGTATVKAHYHDLTATCVVNVQEPKIPLQAIGFSKNKVTLFKGESETVLLTYNPDKFTGSADVTISPSNAMSSTDPTHSASLNAVTALPSSLTGVTSENGPTPVVITAQNAGTSTVTARATIDGKVIETSLEVEVVTQSLDILFLKSGAKWYNGLSKSPYSITKIVFGPYTPDGTEVSWDASEKEDGSIMAYEKNGIIYINTPSNRPVYTKDASGMFSSSSLPYFSKLTDIIGLEHLGLSYADSCAFMFDGAASLTNLHGAESLDMKNIKNMRNMFSNCSSLTSETLQTFSSWDVSNVTLADCIFYKCSSITNVDALSNWDTRHFTNLACAFQECTSLTNVDGLLNWNVSNVKSSISGPSTETDFYKCFYGCSSLQNLNGLRNWNVNGAKQMGSAFAGCQSLTDVSGISPWTPNSLYVNGLFTNCKRLKTIDLSHWNIVPSRNEDMFYNCVLLETIYISTPAFIATKTNRSPVGLPSTCQVIVGSPS